MSRLNGILFNSCNVFACHAARLVLSEIRLFTVRSAKHMTIAFAGWQIFKWQSLLLQGTAGRPRNNPNTVTKVLSTMFCTTRRLFDGNLATHQLQIRVFHDSLEQVSSRLDVRRGTRPFNSLC